MKVLVVDDQPQVRGPIRIKLHNLGHFVIEAENGIQGLARYRETRPDVVLLDLFMPEKDGFETLQELLKINPSATVLAMSGGGNYSNARTLDAASRMGAKAVLTKPFSLEELAQAIARVTTPPTVPNQG